MAAAVIHGSGAASNLDMRGTTVRAVEEQLSRIWMAATTRPANDGVVVTENGAPPARASVLNLVVTVPDEAARQRVLETLLGLGVRHPSRAVILQADPAATGDSLDAWIGTHCHDGEDGAARICFEQVALTVRGEAARHLDGIVAPLVIHDLPTEVWWSGAPPFDDPVFPQLVEMADRVIVDSAGFPDLEAGLRRLAATRRRAGVGDLAWERLGPWQELTAQFFDGPRFRRHLPNLSRLIIRYAVPEQPTASDPSAPEAGAFLFAGWLATRLAWRRPEVATKPATGTGWSVNLEGRYEMVNIIVEPVPTAALPPGELCSVRLRALGETGSAEFIIDRDDAVATIVTNADGMTAFLRRMPLVPESEAEILRRQLVLERRDPVYEDAMRAAAILLTAWREAAA